jgi:hypothetical protein
MQAILDGIAVVLLGYLAFTNFLADQITLVLQPSGYTEETSTPTFASAPTPLPSVYTTNVIPDVLLRSAAYQPPLKVIPHESPPLTRLRHS